MKVAVRSAHCDFHKEKMKGLCIFLLFATCILSQEYAVRFMRAHCFTCPEGGSYGFQVFETKKELLAWLNDPNVPDYPEQRKVFKLEPLKTVEKDLGKTKTIHVAIEKEVPLLEWTIVEN